MAGLVHTLSLPALTLAAFIVSLATVVVPGPITVVASRLVLHRRVASAVWFFIGVIALDVVFFLALAGGAGPLLRRIGALPIVELVGGIALLSGGIHSLRSGPPRPGQPRDYRNRPSGHPAAHFTLGIAVSFGNPHYWIWWVTAGLAFIEAARPHGASGLAWMLAALLGGVVSWYTALLYALRRGRRLLSERAEGLVGTAISVVLVGLGIGLAALGTWRLLV